MPPVNGALSLLASSTPILGPQFLVSKPPGSPLGFSVDQNEPNGPHTEMMTLILPNQALSHSAWQGSTG